ncbi:unnamed protein product [Adineta ricciae]|uniref:Uncharacterized protein n=1 Tax=Adineta ricciae TaxID=249248 RepID=A0A814BUN8_ADIRI|nr:unnamed protein product [Adineta ricciae]CAF0932637.1 unnamed protein product [Adineta ricciae]
MVRLATCRVILFLIVMSVSVSQSRPVAPGSSLSSRLWLKETGFPVTYLDQSDSSSDDVQQLRDNARRKRNCLTYGTNNKHRAAKWMCW